MFVCVFVCVSCVHACAWTLAGTFVCVHALERPQASEAAVLRAFLETFSRTGPVTLADFEDYYANISAVIDDDNVFQVRRFGAEHITRS